MPELMINTTTNLDETTLKLNLLNAKSKLCKALLAHHNFRPRHRELLELSKEFELLKEEGQMLYVSRMEVVPRLSNYSSPDNTIEGVDSNVNRAIPASAYHAQVVAELQEALDMHSSCVYLLELHQAIVSLEAAVSQLCQCVQKRPDWDLDEMHAEDLDLGAVEDEPDPLFPPVSRTGQVDDLAGNVSFMSSDNCELDEDAYRLYTDSVLVALQEAETRFAQATKFSKDNVLIFQGFRRTLIRCKNRLAEHVDCLWRRWIVLRSYQPAESLASNTNLSSALLSELKLLTSDDPLGFLFTSTLPTTAEVAAQISNSQVEVIHKSTIDSGSPRFGTQSTCERGPSLLASFTVYAKPQMLIQLFRLVDALKESKARFQELSTQLYKCLFVPWLSKVPCAAGSKGDKFWPTLETRLIETDQTPDNDQCDCHGSTNKPLGRLIPAWQLELIAPPTVSDEEEQLILDSCRQLTTVFQQLSTYLFGLTLCSSGEDEEAVEAKDNRDEIQDTASSVRSNRVIDVVMNTTSTGLDYAGAANYFDDSLIVALIDGRFTAGLPSARKCGTATFLAPVTQAVYRLAVEGQITGFLTGHSVDKSNVLVPGGAGSGSGGAGLLLHWLNSLSTLTQQTRANEIIDQVRQVLADRELLRATRVVGDRKCSKFRMQLADGMPPAIDGANLQLDEEDEFNGDDEEVQIYREQEATAAIGDPDSAGQYFIPSLSQLLASKSTQEDLARFLDLGHFHFPLSRVSQTVINLLHHITAVVTEAETYLNHKAQTVSQLTANTDPTESGQLDAVQTGALTLVEIMVELVPRAILLFTSLVPVFHAPVLDTDLYVAALYHNDCMFLAHECITLGELRLCPLMNQLAQLQVPRDRNVERLDDELASVAGDEDHQLEESDEHALLRRSASVSTCILVPQLRAAGTEVLLSHLRRQRDHLSDHLKRTRGFRDIGMTENRQRCTEAVNACQTTLISVAEGLSPLPLTVFSRCIGYLCNFVCSEIVHHVLALLDLTQPDCEVLVDLLKEVENTVTHIFSCPPDSELVSGEAEAQLFTKSLGRRVPDLARLQGILSVLTASTMAMIEHELWNGGQGPLATTAQLKASELRGLIEALYSKSAARDQLLRQLR